MKGVGRRVTIGFLSIVALLSVSGMISLFELRNLSYDADVILSAGRRDMVVAKDLLNSAHDHNRAMVDVAIFGDSIRIAECRKAITELNTHLFEMKKDAPEALMGCLDTLLLYSTELKRLADGYGVAPEVVAETDSLQVSPAILVGREWYEQRYEPVHNKFTEQVRYYITLSHAQISPHAEQLSKNAYRAVTPVLISLLVMIAVVLMLYYFIYIFGVKPIQRMNKSLTDYMAYKIPYKVNAEMVDELKELNSSIENLVNIARASKKGDSNAN